MSLFSGGNGSKEFMGQRHYFQKKDKGPALLGHLLPGSIATPPVLRTPQGYTNG
ncbi:hypothetical protein ARMA_1296 [Ardenticatena maritima]|uniref:Uncharacterized protein n=1 Tax=Ardenticatena maritima TaxID=872965 RepID=A0A0M8K8F1_9CHLR|nr:hypothetical protein ARMA_1296 [Ardenticatena maritima]